MKSIHILVIFLLYLVSCRQKSDEIIILEKVQYFDSIGSKLFYNYHVNAIRGGKNSSYQVSRFDTISGYAVVRLYPESEIEKNFIKDTIDLDFVNTFKTLNCYYLVCKDNFVRIDFKTKKNRYLLYKGSPIKTIYLPLDTSKSIKIDNNWAYFKFSNDGK
jgi:hypothetical protein